MLPIPKRVSQRKRLRKMKYFVMAPANNVLRAEKVREFNSADEAADWIDEALCVGDSRDMWVWSEEEYQGEYDARVAPYYRR